MKYKMLFSAGGSAVEEVCAVGAQLLLNSCSLTREVSHQTIAGEPGMQNFTIFFILGNSHYCCTKKYHVMTMNS